MQPTTPSSTSFPAISKPALKTERKKNKKKKLKNNIQTGNIFIKQFLSICVQYSYTIRLACTRFYSSSLSLFTLLLPSPSSVCKLIASESSSYPLVPFVLPEYAAGAGPPWTWRKSRSRSYYTTVSIIVHISISSSLPKGARQTFPTSNACPPIAFATLAIGPHRFNV